MDRKLQKPKPERERERRRRGKYRLLKTIDINDLRTGGAVGAKSGGGDVDEDRDGHLLGDPVEAEREKQMEERAEGHG